MAENVPVQPGADRLETIFSFLKFFVGTVAVSVVTLYFNHQYQSAQLALEEKKAQHAMALQDRQSRHSMMLEEKKAEFDYLGKFMDNAMKEDLKSRMRFADYMRSIALSPNVQKAWLDYHKALEKELLATQKTIETINDRLKEKEDKLAEAVQQNQVNNPEARSLAKEIEFATNSLFKAQEKLDREEYGKAEQRAVNFVDLLTKADDARRIGRYEEERDLLLQAHQNSPRSVHPYILAQLASVYRALRQFDLAHKYSEMVMELVPANATALYNHAIMQKNDKRLPDAIKTLEKAGAIAKEPQKTQIEVAMAGYLIHAGKREDGMRRFAQVKDRALADDTFAAQLAWFYAVADQKAEFYQQFEIALRLRRERTLRWIDQEVDIDKFRGEERFKKLVEAARAG